MKRMYSLMALLLSLALLLCGCASAGRDTAQGAPAAPSGEVNLSSTSMDRGDAEYAEEMGPEPAPPSDAAQQGEAAGEALAARKIIRDAELEVQTLSYDEFLPALETAIDEAGGYVGSVSEGDFLRHVMAVGTTELRAHEQYRIASLVRRDFCPPLSIEAEDATVIEAIMNQNFVPIVDDRGALCGILTRRAVIGYLARAAVR